MSSDKEEELVGAIVFTSIRRFAITFFAFYVLFTAVSGYRNVGLEDAGYLPAIYAAVALAAGVLLYVRDTLVIRDYRKKLRKPGH